MRYVLSAFLAFIVVTPASAHPVDPPGFLSFSASRTLLRNSRAVIVDVGLRARRNDNGQWQPAQSDDVWFQATVADTRLGEPGRRRWTDGRSCPQAITVLQRVRSLSMPRPVLPIPDPSGEWDSDGDLYLDGRVYSLDVRSANVNGQAVGTISMSSNLNTELSRWVEDMLAALEPCWSRTMPTDMDGERGTDWDARYNGPLRQPDH